MASRRRRTGQSMYGRHAALGQPLVGHPGPAGKGEAERVLTEHLPGGEHPLAGDDVPETAGVVQHRAPTGQQQEQPERNEDEG